MCKKQHDLNANLWFVINLLRRETSLLEMPFAFYTLLSILPSFAWLLTRFALQLSVEVIFTLNTTRQKEVFQPVHL